MSNFVKLNDNETVNLDQVVSITRGRWYSDNRWVHRVTLRGVNQTLIATLDFEFQHSAACCVEALLRGGSKV